MSFDDPIVWVLLATVVVFLFGASRIPQFARAIGQARNDTPNPTMADPRV